MISRGRVKGQGERSKGKGGILLKRKPGLLSGTVRRFRYHGRGKTAPASYQLPLALYQLLVQNIHAVASLFTFSLTTFLLGFYMILWYKIIISIYT